VTRAVFKTVGGREGVPGRFDSCLFRQMPIRHQSYPSEKYPRTYRIGGRPALRHRLSFAFVRRKSMGNSLGNLMAQTIGKQTALTVSQAKQRGYYGDGGGLRQRRGA
jgi:hypothetical protein